MEGGTIRKPSNTPSQSKIKYADVELEDLDLAYPDSIGDEICSEKNDFEDIFDNDVLVARGYWTTLAVSSSSDVESERGIGEDERMAELEEDELAADDSMDEDDSSYRYDPALVPSKLENGAEDLGDEWSIALENMANKYRNFLTTFIHEAMELETKSGISTDVIISHCRSIALLSLGSGEKIAASAMMDDLAAIVDWRLLAERHIHRIIFPEDIHRDIPIPWKGLGDFLTRMRRRLVDWPDSVEVDDDFELSHVSMEVAKEFLNVKIEYWTEEEKRATKAIPVVVSKAKRPRVMVMSHTTLGKRKLLNPR